jgi:hypothetical protein
MYEGYIEADVPVNATHLIGGDFKVKPEQPNSYSVWNASLFIWEDSTDLLWQEIRARRNKLISATDWTQLPDVSNESKEAWGTYRQALRDITDQPDPFNITWPISPE